MATKPRTTPAAAAINQLELLDPSDAWLDTAHPLLTDCAPCKLRDAEESGGLVDEDLSMDEVSLAGGMDGGDDAAAADGAARARSAARRQHGSSAGSMAGVVTLAALRREAALFAAAASLAASLPGLQVLRPPALAPDYLYDQTLGAGRLAEAEALAHALWRGGELEERLERLAGAAAARCMRAQVGGADGSAAAEAGDAQALAAAAGDSAWDDCSSGGVAAGGRPGYLGSSAAGAWQRLRALLARYETAERRRLAGRLRVAAIDAALSEAPGAALPAWLIAPFAPSSSSSASSSSAAGGMAGGPEDPAALLRVYLRHGRLDDAADLALEHLSAWQGANPLARCKPASSWVPLRQLEVLDACLGDAAAAAQQGEGGGGPVTAQRLAGLSTRLRAAVGEHLALGARDSRIAASGDGGGGGGTGMSLG